MIMNLEENYSMQSFYFLFFLFSVGFVVLFLEVFGLPTRRGFYCDDDSIKYPYRGNTVSEVLIVLGAILFPVFVVSII